MSVTPTTPQDIRDGTAVGYDSDFAEDIINYINGILALPPSVALLEGGEFVPIYDQSKSEQWLIGCEDAVKQFSDTGWQVQGENGEYYFRLPL